MPIEHIETLREGEDQKEKLKVVERSGVEPWGRDASLSVVGEPHTRVEGPEKVTGRARYAYDIRLPGQLYARVLRSPHPHARVRRVDSSAAEALEGVHAVLSMENAPDIRWYENSKLFDSTVRFVGEEVAAVAAENEEVALDALRLIEVEYEPLPFVTDMLAALEPHAPAVHEGGNRVGEPKLYERGDVATGLEEADVIVEGTFYTQTALHNCLEPHGCTASWDGDSLTLYESTQGVFEVREQVAEKLGLREDRVRVVKRYMGGGFGSKQIAWKQTVIAALLSQLTGQPVQLMLDREAENLAAGNRNPTHQRVRLGARSDGTLTAIELEATLGVGAYMVGGEASNVGGPYQRLYRCPNVRTRKTAAYINAGPSVAFRAPGYVEGAWALEQAMDELARRLDVDPVELRRKNYADWDQKKDRPYTSPESLRIAYDKVTEAFGWDGYRRLPADGAKRRGIGFAAHEWGGAGHAPGYAWVKLNSDGTADVVTGTQDIGTGTRTGLTQVAAETLGLPMAQITLHLGDTAQGPYSPVSAGSATQATLGPAVRAAAADAREQLLQAAALLLEVEDPETLDIRDGIIFIVGGREYGRSEVEVREVMGRMAPHMILGQGMRGPNPEDKSVRTFGAQCVEVEVDVETGEVTVLRVAASHDCGRVINPTMVNSQVLGGVTQGIGFALMEERILDDRLGFVLNPNLEHYKVPTVADVPPTTHNAVDRPDPEANPTGAKGIGEPPIIPTAPAIANAIYDATGVRIREAPLTQWRVLRALLEKGKSDTNNSMERERR
ncbi:MAG: xanthine dehydrogenase family protein molybdopterin-binding subunit [Candidatus Promineifilaceae bacterium]|nr:xanthine dehydrogenase family protein molybdopterin-binding subunit [Candidatus Promineifilaceae bacterium]